jgi:fatty acid cis/trans isomerase CTI
MKSRVLIILLLVAISACATIGTINFEKLYGPAEPRDRTIAAVSPGEVDYWQSVKPILDNRCVVCHACYDAPCQLKLTAVEGLERGAHKDGVYNLSRLTPDKLTRLFEDGHSVQDWRDKGFFPVLNENAKTLEANRDASVMYQILDLKERHPLSGSSVLPDDYTLGIDRDHTCPKPETFGQFAAKHPSWGMPYALPGLSTEEQSTLKQWLEQGATYTPRKPLSIELNAKQAQWEAFLNRNSLRAQLVSRYIYEHLFLANIYFEDVQEKVFFKLVRSATPPGQPVQRISTRRPYDDPGVEHVYYRLLPEFETTVVKTHMPYRLNVERMNRWQSLFYDTPYEVTYLPGYEPKQAANPFDSFKQLPMKSRYKFMLDEAQFTIMNFIKGPVCRGQVALNVIKDHFWVYFVNPDLNKDEAFTEFLISHKHEMELPSTRGDIYMPLINWHKYSSKQRKFLAAKDEFLLKNFGSQNKLGLDVIWDGNGSNPNAALTIFRHFDSATVEKGLIGPPPQTAWLIDYSLLERIHYLLVAGYDVYGNLGHQLLSRLHMDFLRMEGESNFLSLLPKDARQKERENWYRITDPSVMDFLTNPSFENAFEPTITYTSSDKKHELYQLIEKKVGPALSDRRTFSSLKDPALEKSLTRLGSLKGTPTTLISEVSIIQIVDTSAEDKNTYITLIRNNAHLNITSMFGEKKTLIPEENTVTVAPGLIGAYPNVFLKVGRKHLDDFVDRVLAMREPSDYTALLDAFGVRRTNPDFWAHSDKVHNAMRDNNPVEAALLDYSRLDNR